jgi:hypothetical protein
MGFQQYIAFTILVLCILLMWPISSVIELRWGLYMTGTNSPKLLLVACLGTLKFQHSNSSFGSPFKFMQYKRQKQIQDTKETG